MTRKRYKKLLMGRYKFSRNEAEAISRWETRSIEEKEDTTIIGGCIAIFKPNHWRVMQREKYIELMWENYSKLIAEGIDRGLNYD